MDALRHATTGHYTKWLSHDFCPSASCPSETQTTLFSTKKLRLAWRFSFIFTAIRASVSTNNMFDVLYMLGVFYVLCDFFYLCLITFLWIDNAGSHITLQPKTGCPLKLSRVEPGQYLDGRPPGKTRLLLEEVLVRPAGGAHPVVCVGPNTPV